MDSNPTDILWGHIPPVWKLKVGEETWYDTLRRSKHDIETKESPPSDDDSSAYPTALCHDVNLSDFHYPALTKPA